jgi:hypothetical protein
MKNWKYSEIELGTSSLQLFAIPAELTLCLVLCYRRSTLQGNHADCSLALLAGEPRTRQPGTPSRGTTHTAVWRSLQENHAHGSLALLPGEPRTRQSGAPCRRTTQTAVWRSLQENHAHGSHESRSAHFLYFSDHLSIVRAFYSCTLLLYLYFLL